ncbi:hypothetical protein [Streptomyces sp. AD55]|uniref:hypothetical protein n=1 Tax=Streptomyces sp. AD55 TaxID=3242895 RepID=UPI003529361D
MTQSGQGEEPSARPAHEGIVLPSDGGDPLLPGSAGASAGPQAGPPAPASAPPGGQTWDQPWGPAQPGQAHGADQGWPTPPGAQPWGAPEVGAQAWSAPPPQAPGAVPPHAPPGPLPPEDAGVPGYGAPAYGAPAPYYPPHDTHGQHGPQHGGHGPQHGGHGPQHGGHGQYGGQASVPAPADEGATQFLPPVPISDEGATQYIPPVGPGALPPEQPPGADADATQYIPPVPSGPAPHGGSDAEATQYIPPVPGGPAYGDEGRQPPAEFDNLFRGADGGSSSTQQMPVMDVPHAMPPAGGPGRPPARGGGGRRRGGGRGGGGRTGSRVPLFAAVGVGLAVVGVGAGALMAGGGDDRADGQTVSATAPVSGEPESPAPSEPPADPAREQAEALDKLLADSGSSRATVIQAVADVKSCNNLEQAAEDLREAATQRAGLVTSLSELSVDRLPRHAELTDALTKAWHASEAADNHYAAWADQAAGKKGCKKGKARTTSETQAGNRESGTATAEKAKAAKLWNAIAQRYGLTQREPTQL